MTIANAITKELNEHGYDIGALILSTIRSLSMYFYQFDSMAKLPIIVRIIVTFFRVVAYFVVFKTVIRYSQDCLPSLIVENKSSAFNQPTGASAFLRICVTFAVIWLPVLIIKYPGAMCWDTWRALNGYRNCSISAHDPVFYTLIMGLLIDIFSTIGHPNWGLFAFVFLHYLVQILAAAMIVITCSKMGLKKSFLLIVGLSIAFNPIVIGYIGVAFNDSLYASLISIMTSLLINICINNDGFSDLGNESSCHPFDYLLLSLVAFSAALVRKNGIHIVIGTLLLYVVLLMWGAVSRSLGRLHSYKRRKNCLVIVASLLCAVVLAFPLNYLLEHQVATVQGSLKEALSFPFQQIARVVTYHGDELPYDEVQIISSVLDYDRLPELYDPRISDPVKNTYHAGDRYLSIGDSSAAVQDGVSAEREDLNAFLLVWMKELLRYPLCCLSASFHQNYYLFVPESEVDDIVIYQDDDIGFEDGTRIVVSERTSYYEDIFFTPSFLVGIKAWWTEEIIGLYHSIPLMLICNSGIIIIAFFVVFIVALCNKTISLLPFFPSVLTFITVLLGPAIHGHPRYVFPIALSLPILICYVSRCRFLEDHLYATERQDS